MSAEEKKKKLLDWILKNKQPGSSEEINFETPLLEKKIISSLKIMEMIVFLESLRGAPVDVDQLKPGAFSSIDTIFDKLVKD